MHLAVKMCLEILILRPYHICCFFATLAYCIHFTLALLMYTAHADNLPLLDFYGWMLKADPFSDQHILESVLYLLQLHISWK